MSFSSLEGGFEYPVLEVSVQTMPSMDVGAWMIHVPPASAAKS